MREKCPKLNCFETGSNIDSKKLKSSGRRPFSKRMSEVETVNEKIDTEASEKMLSHIYVGETARTLRQRCTEHLRNAKNWVKNSFILRHWMLAHGSEAKPPDFEFKIIRRFKDPLSRQIMEAIVIQERGTLNQKNEFGANFLCRLVPAGSAWEEEKEQADTERERKRIESNIKEFVSVMSNVYEINKSETCPTNLSLSSRQNKPKRKRGIPTAVDKESRTPLKTKKRKMNCHSTPSNERHNGDEQINNDPELISPILANNRIISNDSDTIPGSDTNDSSGPNLAPARARTNISDDLWQMRIRSLGERRNNDSSTELAVSFLCLEEAINRRGLLPARIQRRLEWLDLEGVTDMIGDIKVEDWSTGSWGSKDSTQA